MVKAFVVMVLCALGISMPAPANPGDRTELGIESERIRPVEPDGEWAVTATSWTAERTPDARHGGERGLLMRPKALPTTDPFGVVLRILPAAPYRGMRVAYRSWVRVVDRGPSGRGQAQAWLRVDRANDEMGAFDNMGDRPITAATWTEAVIEADVAHDAARLVVGVLSIGEATVAFDDVSIEVLGPALGVQQPSPPAPLEGRGLANVRAAAQVLSCLRFFHPSDQAVGVADWGRYGVVLIDAAEPATDAVDLARRLEAAIGPIAPTARVWPTAATAPAAAAVPEGTTRFVSWRHLGAGRVGTLDKGMNIYSSEIESLPVTDGAGPPDATMDLPLDGGVTLRLPVRVAADATGTLPHGATPEELRGDARQSPLSALNRSTRLAAVALAWGVFQHFYPYFDAVDVDWNAALTTALEQAATDGDEAAFLMTLERLVARLHDGHGAVRGPGAGGRTRLPLAFAWAGDHLVVTGACGEAAKQVAVGDEVESINGRATSEWLAELGARVSHATEGWLRARSAGEFAMGSPWKLSPKSRVGLGMIKPDGTTYSVVVAPTNDCVPNDATARRPANGEALAPGILYFNLDGASSEALAAVIDQLVAADGIVFDLRGYPNQAAYEVIERLIDAPSASARWIVPVVTRPNQADVVWQERMRWNMVPHAQRLPKNVAFVTDGRAISYAESIMGIVEAYKLGAIVGATTAGTNGNVNPFTVPGGYTITWTGMRVLKHDGSRHHGVGITPTVPATPTPKGIAEGRDEVLERAVEVVAERQRASK